MVRDLSSPLRFMLRRSSLVECVSALHGTCLQCAERKYIHQDLILATCFPLYYIVMRAERPILLRFLNVLTSLNGFIIKRIC
jgi:hypothetical protein